MPSIMVKKSKIQGEGVFAGKNFRKGAIVLTWDTSMILTKAEAKRIPTRYKKYLVFSKGKFIVAQNPEKYLNHSCNPNTIEKDFCDVAARGIKKGEELTTDYSLDAPPHIKMKCNCGQKNCKKII
ncbi:MAG: SET domain-containing protein-lysine N-methyltransferase [archaeon]